MDTLDEKTLDQAWKLFDALSISDGGADAPARCSKCSRPLEENDRAEGYRVCTDCGKVSEIYIDDKAEWRTQTDANTGVKKAKQDRCGAAPGHLFPKSSLSTTISGPAGNRLQRTHQWNSMTSSERSLHQTMRYYENLEAQNKLGLQVTSTATEIFSSLSSTIDAFSSGGKRNNHKQALQAACLYFACRKVGCPRNRREISAMTDVPLRFVTKGINMFMDIMGGEYDDREPLRAQDFAPRYCSALHLPFQFQKQLLTLLDIFDELGVQFGVSPCSTCCGAIYFLCQLTRRRVTREAIHAACGSSVAVMGKVQGLMHPLAATVQDRLGI